MLTSTATPAQPAREVEEAPTAEVLLQQFHALLHVCKSLQASNVVSQTDHDLNLKGAPIWLGELPSTCQREVVDAALEFGAYVAKNGMGEKTVAAGVSLVLGDGAQLRQGLKGCLNKYQGLKITVLDILAPESKEMMTLVLPGDAMIDIRAALLVHVRLHLAADFGSAGKVLLIDGQSGELIAIEKLASCQQEGCVKITIPGCS